MGYPEAPPTPVQVAISAGIFACLCLVGWMLARRLTWTIDAEDRRIWTLVAVAATVVIVYVSGTNYDYRLQVLSFAVAPLVILMRFQSGTSRLFVAITLGCLCAGPWLSIPMHRLVQVAGDVVLLIGIAGMSVIGLIIVFPARRNIAGAGASEP